MNKVDYINRLSEKLGYTKKDTKIIINELFEEIKKDLKQGIRISINNFGTFEVGITKEFESFSPKDGSTIIIPNQKRVHFKSSENFKNFLNE